MSYPFSSPFVHVLLWDMNICISVMLTSKMSGAAARRACDLASG
jgi:hypothetical protein